MNVKISALSGVLLASMLSGQQALAQQATPAKAAPVFVPLPKDIQCTVQGMSFRSVVGDKGQLINTDGSVDGLTCWVAGKTPEQKNEIPLASTEITRGMLPTRDFGKLKITPTNNINSVGVSIAIRRDKLQSFRAFLQKPESAKGAGSVSNADQTVDAFVSLPDDIGCSFRGIEFESVVGSNKMNGSVDGITCWIGNKISAHKKDIALASTEISDRMLPTKNFGDFKLGSENNLMDPGISVAIRRDKLQLFRDFLSEQIKEVGTDDRFIA
jgi:hypothetical protein